MKKITKKEMKEFIKEATQILSECDVEKGNSEYYSQENTFSINSDYLGKLSIKIDGDSSYCYTIFARFENVDIAKKHFNCNPYSGKHNCHSYNKEEAIYFLDELLNGYIQINERELKAV